MLALALLALPLGAAAEGIKPTRREAVLTADGRLSISSRFQTDLPDQLKDALSDIEANEIKAQIRLNLSMGNLPKPFQINALTSKSWNLDSGWQTLQVKPQH